MPDTAAHPDIQELTAFGLGRLAEGASLLIEQHLASCATCRSLLDTLPADSFINLVRTAEPPADAGLSVSSARTLSFPSTPAADTANVPPELADHPKYRIIEMVGCGGMGAVYKAEHLLMERTVALKVISRELLNNPATVERFRREFKTAARLIHHNIVHAYDADQAGEVHFLVMEFVEGRSLAQLVEERGPLPVREACDYIRQAALGLQHIHEHGMVHRDIKPHNLMVSGVASAPRENTPPNARGADATPLPGIIKILDCGLARFALESAPPLATAATVDATKADTVTGTPQPAHVLTQTGAVMGTPDYIAPEQARDAHSADIRADIYSLGCTFYDLLSGKPPFHEGTVVQKILAHIERAPKSLSELRPDLPIDVVRIVEKMMAKEPDQRYQTPAEVADALASFGRSEPEASATVTQPETRAQPLTLAHASGSDRRRGRRWALGAAVVVLLGLGAALLPPVRDFAATVIRIATNTGAIEIETDDDAIEVTIAQAGKTPIVKVIDKKSKLTFELTAEGGDISVKEMPDGARAKTTKFELARGDKIIFRAEALLLTDAELAAKAPQPDKNTGDFQPLFNGKDLTGWEGDTKVWSWASVVGKGEALVGEATYVKGLQNHRLTSTRIYKDFELKFRASNYNNIGIAGVGVRGKAGIPIGPAKHLGCFSTGLGIGKYLKWPRDRDAVAKVLKLGFNDFHIRCVGKHVTLKVNGVTTIDEEFDDLPAQGPLSFQVSGGSDKGFGTSVTIRDILIRDLSPTAPPEPPVNFQPLFTGTGLSGWQNEGKKWLWKEAKEGGLKESLLVGTTISDKETKDFFLRSTKGFKDFELKFQASMSNTYGTVGVLVRDTAGLPIGPSHHLGKFYTTYGNGKDLKIGKNRADLEKALKLGYNDFAIKCVGKHVTLTVNGITTIDADFTELRDEGTLAFHVLGAAGVGAHVMIKNIEIREIAPATLPVLVFEPLFTGKNLTAWVGDQKPWIATGDGVKTKGPATAYLRTAKKYDDYELTGEFQCPDPRPSQQVSGLLLHVQDPGGETSSGYLISMANPAEAAIVARGPDKAQWQGDKDTSWKSKPKGEWNHLRVRCQGDTIELWINGERIGSMTGCSLRQGYIALHAQDNEIHFRNLAIAELSRPKPPTQPGISLFNGKDLSGWQARITATEEGPYQAVRFTNWVAENGSLLTPLSATGYLLTDQDYWEYELQLEYKLMDTARSPAGLELAVHKGWNDKLKKLGSEVLLQIDQAGKAKLVLEKDGVLTGSETLGPPAKVNPLRFWNKLKLVCQGEAVKVWLNDHFLGQAANTGLKKGLIALKGNRNDIYFRNIQIKILETASPMRD